MSQVKNYLGHDCPVRLSISKFDSVNNRHGAGKSPRYKHGTLKTHPLSMKDLRVDVVNHSGRRKVSQLPANIMDTTFVPSRYATEFFKAQDRLRTDTPDTLMTEFTNKPDITVRCEKCGIFIDIRTIQDHRSFHAALTLMKYKCSTLPDKTDALLKRRNAIMRRLKSQATQERPIDPKDIQIVNDAYERLKSDIEDTYDMCRQIRHVINTNVNGVALNCSPSCAIAVGLCSSQNETWKSAMEDTRVFQDYFGDDPNKCYLALFDGHHGSFAAEVAASELHKLLLNEMSKFDPRIKSLTARNQADVTDISEYKFVRPETEESERVLLHGESLDLVHQIIAMCEEKYAMLMADKSTDADHDRKRASKSSAPKHPLSPKIANAFKKVHHLIDILLSYGKDERSKVRWSGCSTLTAIIHAKDSDSFTKLSENSPTLEIDKEDNDGIDPPVQLGLIHLANAGNVHALLVRGNRPYRLTKDHTPNNSRERRRVIQHGGTISESLRESQVNGVLATTRGLGNHGDMSLKRCIQVDPSTVCVEIDQYAQFLVLATNGIWEIFSDQEVMSLLLKMLPTHQVPPPRCASSSLGPLLEELDINEKDKEAAVALSLLDRNVSFSNNNEDGEGIADMESKAPITDPSANTPADIKDNETTQKGQSQSKNITSTPVERGGQIHENFMKIEADLKTEIGSHVEDGSDLEQDPLDGEMDDGFTTLPVHTDIPDYVAQTEEDKHRDLAKGLAEYLVQAALLAGAKDNITVSVVLLPGCGL